MTSTVRVGVGTDRAPRRRRCSPRGRPKACTVTAATPSLLTAPRAARTFAPPRSSALPTGRTPSLVAELAPGLTNNTPNVNQVTISGAVAYDNVFLLDGVDIGDNLFARPDDLFIEEAIEETQVLTSAVSAEYGRFSGGVVNAVTKRGGNLFSGSVRSNLSNAAWTEETPFEKATGQQRAEQDGSLLRGHVRRPAAQGQACGSSSRAARSRATTSLTLAQTAAPFQQTDDQHRWDLKVTATPLTNQTVQVQYHGSPPEAVRAVAADHDRSDRRRPHRHARRPVRGQLERRRWPTGSSRPRSTRARPTIRASATPARACRIRRS